MTTKRKNLHCNGTSYINMLKCRHVSSRTITSFFLSDFPPLEIKLLGLPVCETTLTNTSRFKVNSHFSLLQVNLCGSREVCYPQWWRCSTCSIVWQIWLGCEPNWQTLCNPSHCIAWSMNALHSDSTPLYYTTHYTKRLINNHLMVTAICIILLYDYCSVLYTLANTTLYIA